jgi:polysaccharide export outer membrane protein
MKISIKCLVGVLAAGFGAGALGADSKFADFPGLGILATNASAASSSPAAPATAKSLSGTTAPTLTGTNGMGSLDDKYRLAIGDRLSFRIVEDEDDPKSVFVTDSGDLEVPYIGRFPAVGKSCKELAHGLKTELEKEYYYNATVVVAVDLMTKSRGKVYLAGHIRVPGTQEIPSDEVLTVSKAIMRAGGFDDFADKHKVRVTRKGQGTPGGDKTYIVDVAQILEKGKTENDLPLEPSDIIFIPERIIRL